MDGWMERQIQQEGVNQRVDLRAGVCVCLRGRGISEIIFEHLDPAFPEIDIVDIRANMLF